MNLTVYRDYSDGLVALGNLVRENGNTAFCYNQEYLARADAAAVSLSLPLQEKPFSEEELLPYFKGLLPEGEALENLCRSMGILTGDYFTMDVEGSLLNEQGFKSAPYIADELREEMLPRLEVLSKI